MPAFSSSASIVIKAPPAKICTALTDFNTWPVWSPWLYSEPDANVNYVGTVHEPGHGYNWKGKKTGEGSMELVSSEDNHVYCDLQFIKPFKSSAKVRFDLVEQADASTEVSWVMDSQLPFFMFFMKGMMIAFIRSDFTRGLRLLKDYIEEGAIHSSTVVSGIVDVEPQQFVGVAAETAMPDMQTSMEASFSSLMPALKNAGIVPSGPAMAQYDKFDIKANRCRYVAGILTSDAQTVEPPALIREIPACRAYKLVHTGRYEHLGNAWSTGMMNLRAEKLKASKGIKPFEIYLNDPETTASEDLVTELYLPIR